MAIQDVEDAMSTTTDKPKTADPRVEPPETRRKRQPRYNVIPSG